LHERYKLNFVSGVKIEVRFSARAFELGDFRGFQMKRKLFSQLYCTGCKCRESCRASTLF